MLTKERHSCTNLMFIRRLTSQFIQLFRKSKTSDKILNLEKKMEITRHNFAEKLPVIEEAIKGQLISKCPFSVKSSSKKPPNFFPGFLP